MTNQFYGSSLFQARKTEHAHRHAQLHDRKINRHLRSHAEFHRRHEDSEPAAVLNPRDSTITEVVQTISVVQVIDGSGATVERCGSFDNRFFRDRDHHFFRGPRINSCRDCLFLNTDTSDGCFLNFVLDLDFDPNLKFRFKFHLKSGRNFWSRHLSYILSLINFFISFELPFLELCVQLYYYTVTTDTWVASATLFQSSSSSSLSSLGTTLPSSGTSSGSTSNSASSGSFSSSTSSSSSSTSTDASSSGWSSFSESASATYGAGGSDGSASVYATPTSTSASTTSGASSGSSNGGSTTAPTSTVVGGVVGGVAGLALLVAFAFMLLRLKKNGWGHMRPGNGNVGSAPEARTVGPPPGPSSGGDGGGNGAYGTMERAAPYSVASSLAALAGKRASRSRASSGPEMAERGFVRVSGKKLPPVLQFGGDGYTDPRDRDSVTSDVTVYRDSMAVFNPGQQRLALGSPMRPESGVLVYNPGPAKTPVTSLVPNPLDSPTLPRSSTFPPTDAMGTTLAEGAYSNEASSSRDAVGRTLAAQDYSRDGAASRTSRQSRQSGKFTEHVH